MTDTRASGTALLDAPSTALDGENWRTLEAEHRERAERLTAAHRARASRGEKHPVEDFLFTYYSYKPALLRRWHPGSGVLLRDAEERTGWRWYRAGSEANSVTVDEERLRVDRGGLLRSIHTILSATARRDGVFGCFGLHEWAMVYRSDRPRHEVPLRLGADGTDAVVEAHDLRCTHFDAFRFFTDDAVPRNREVLSRDTQAAREQLGCLHAGMDVYRWAVKLGPLVPGDLLLDAFELARDIRTLDMRASPYDLRAWGYEPVTIETTDGKAAYVREQRVFAVRSAALRERLIAISAPARTE